MPSLGPAEILVVLVIALLVFGPDKMPDIARQVGRGFREFRRVQNHLKAELRDVVSEFDSSEAPTVTPPPPTVASGDVSADDWAKENTGTPVPTATGDPLPSLPPLASAESAPPAPPAEVALPPVPPAEVTLPPAEVALPPAEVALPPAEPPAENA